jgi:hypothetical protein
VLVKKEECIMPLKKLRDFFEAHNITFKTISHTQAFTTQEIAASTYSGKGAGQARHGEDR